MEEFVTKIKQFHTPVDTELFDSIVTVVYTHYNNNPVQSIPGPEFIGKRCFKFVFENTVVYVTEKEILRCFIWCPIDKTMLYTVTPHNIQDMAVLRTMKHFQLNETPRAAHNWTVKGVQLYKEQPTYFMPNCVAFMIKEQKASLEVSMLEQKLKDMEEREHRLKCEREKLNEDTQALLIVKQQIEAKAAELQREREQFNAVLEHI
jgi:hypothetical protein